MPRTKIDDLIDLLKQNKKLTYLQISKQLSWPENSVERVCLILEESNLLETYYPITLVQKPWVRLDRLSEVNREPLPSGTVVDNYQVSSSEGHASSQVRIILAPNEKRPIYTVELPYFSAATRAYMEHVKIEASSALPLSFTEVSKDEATRIFNLRHSFISDVIKRDLSPEPDALELIADTMIDEMYGLGKIEALISDSNLEEIIINSSRLPISVYHRKYGWLITNVFVKNEDETANYSEQIARKVGRQISTLNPILDAHLGTGDRVNATLYPVSAHGNTITMRLFARNPWTVVSYLRKENSSLSVEMAALLWQAIQYEMNVLIAGGTASGKTSVLNGLLALVQPYQRIVTIEDTRELLLPQYQWNWVPLVTRPPNPEGIGEVTMLDLVVNALRMRPDRIVMGEIRRKREAEVLFEAMHTGHSVYSTLHADTGTQVIKRLIEPPIEVPPAQVEDIHLLLVQYRDRRKNIRRTLEISEVIPGERIPDLNRVFTWRPRSDSFQKVKEPHRYIEQLNLHTGMTEKEIDEDQQRKVMILQWMLENNIDHVEDVGRVMKTYYSDEAAIFDAAQKHLPASKIL